MSAFRPSLMEARTPLAQMTALCEFIEFWLGPRQPSFGEAEGALSRVALPMPLRHLYQFAGRWPRPAWPKEPDRHVPAFCIQDLLRRVSSLSYEREGRVIFADENQGGWTYQTLTEGDDPPVWWHDSGIDDQGKFVEVGGLICDSLSSFLVTFVMRELAFGSAICRFEQELYDRFVADQGPAVLVWRSGPNDAASTLGDSDFDFYLQGDALVVFRRDQFRWFAVNHEASLGRFRELQGPIRSIELVLCHRRYESWELEIFPDGSARIDKVLRQREGGTEVPPGTFDFSEILDKLSGAASGRGESGWQAIVTFHRTVDFFEPVVKYLRDQGLASALLRQALERAIEPDQSLLEEFASEGHG